MAGGDLWKRLANLGRFTEPQAATYAREIVSAVAHLHAMNVVHRDLKPENCLFERDTLDSPLKLTSDC